MNSECVAFQVKSTGAKDCWLYNDKVAAASTTMLPDSAHSIHFVKCFSPEPRAPSLVAATHW
jgi:hypothetical protein